MDWNMIVAIAQAIAALGVVASVAYVGKQVKETNAMTRSAARQEASSEINAWAMTVAASPHLCAVSAKTYFEGLVRDKATEMEKISIGFAYVGIS
ncbi:MAG: hypothetical protein OEZ08_00955 [Betaproteobacteria bacterium]|nr:hypothetical protein [Betaproteobacteria bacterium]